MIDSFKLYRFPANSRAEALTLREQIDYVLDEAAEAAEAHAGFLGDEQTIGELWDVIHAAEGALRKFDPKMVTDCYYLTMAKNNRRGDYSDEAVSRDDWGLV